MIQPVTMDSKRTNRRGLTLDFGVQSKPSSNPVQTQEGGTPTKINEHLYLGGIDDDCREVISKVHRVISVIKSMPSFAQVFVEKGKHLHIPINDDQSANILEHVDAVINFIQEGIEQNEVTFIHCQAGISRSASFVIAYLMKTENLSSDDATKKVIEMRSKVAPNIHFCINLKNYEKKLKDSNI